MQNRAELLYLLLCLGNSGDIPDSLIHYFDIWEDLVNVTKHETCMVLLTVYYNLHIVIVKNYLIFLLSFTLEVSLTVLNQKYRGNCDAN
jgi:hypothetical protein